MNKNIFVVFIFFLLFFLNLSLLVIAEEENTNTSNEKFAFEDDDGDMTSFKETKVKSIIEDIKKEEVEQIERSIKNFRKRMKKNKTEDEPKHVDLIKVKVKNRDKEIEVELEFEGDIEELDSGDDFYIFFVIECGDSDEDKIAVTTRITNTSTYQEYDVIKDKKVVDTDILEYEVDKEDRTEFLFKIDKDDFKKTYSSGCSINIISFIDEGSEIIVDVYPNDSFDFGEWFMTYGWWMLLIFISVIVAVIFIFSKSRSRRFGYRSKSLGKRKSKKSLGSR
jgi:hypothetical protein